MPSDSVIVKKETLKKLMGEAIYQKQLLLECLERERSK
jgi:hypothetical protein